ncbi:uncharacterized protein [Rutidosis leptorrhynchoides]|uniref:uncharacterized protein n=1 Tax=Rutidosis leptorrhynchoides TaxID=125765 RepID=UPI003A991A64
MDAYLKIVDDDSSDDEISVMRSCAEELDREAGEGPNNFCLCVTDLYQQGYLRKPTARDMQRIYERHETKHGIRGMIGNIDCMHWEWKNCPVAWQERLPSPFTINGHDYTHGYYVADGIYPDWATLIKAYQSPTDEPSTKFTRFQESARKDVERTFGVLQGRFNILRVPGRAWRAKKLHRILYCCVLLHNMIQEDNGFAVTSLDEEYLNGPENRPVFVRNRNTTRAAREKKIRDKDVHNALRADLTAHIWNLPPNYRRTI